VKYPSSIYWCTLVYFIFFFVGGNQKKEETVKDVIPKDFEECKAFLFGHHGTLEIVRWGQS
jgi:hypothetical protein